MSGDLRGESQDIPEPAVGWRGNSHRMPDKTRHRLFQYFRLKPTGTSTRNGGGGGGGRKYRQANGGTSRLHGPVKKAHNRGSPEVNLSLPLPPLSPPTQRQNLAVAVSGPFTEHIFLSHRQVVWLFNKYRI